MRRALALIVLLFAFCLAEARTITVLWHEAGVNQRVYRTYRVGTRAYTSVRAVASGAVIYQDTTAKDGVRYTFWVTSEVNGKEELIPCIDVR